MLITGDGHWSHRVTSPKFECKKTYRVETTELLTEKMLQKLAEGVWLEAEGKRTKPAEVELLAGDELELRITEGKYHQVKRMLIAVENQVASLHRSQIGAIKLDPSLAPGDYRPLTDEEIASV